MTFVNRLASEQSPYLLQHRHNPVAWYPWSEEAFERARAEDRPIFLSIGYATCHWCHVMERESFEDEEVARLLNDSFVSIKVDREERPDIDGIYMAVCQMLTGQGGWPLTIVMTPDRRPFFAATYIPKHSRHGRTGMTELLPRIASVWRHQREDVLRSADHLTEVLQRATTVPAAGTVPDEKVLEAGFRQLSERFDGMHGGFGSAPKFPTPHNLFFLLRYAARTGDASARQMVTETLDAMMNGGIFDHLGGGFHRYATDAVWLLPHFEKMLYDQALLSTAYTEGYLASGREAFAEVTHAVLRYVLRDLRSPEGAFYCAEDADSEGREGLFYLWTVDEVESVLDAEDAAMFCRVYSVIEDGNFEDEATGDRTGENVLHRAERASVVALELGVAESELEDRLARARAALRARREARVRPERDDKVLTDWNGLMIAALAIAARALREPAYLEHAQRAADFIRERLRTPDGALLHRARNGIAGIDAMADDFAALAWAMIELYESSFIVTYLEQAMSLADEMHARFWDDAHGGYFTAGAGVDDLIVRQKEYYDGAIPSANSLQAWNLVRLARITGQPRFEDRAHEVMSSAAAQVNQHPSAYTMMLIAVDMASRPSTEVVIVGDPVEGGAAKLLDVVREMYRPELVVLCKLPGEAGERLAESAPFVAEQRMLDGRATAYLCRDFACQMPTDDPEVLRKQLKEFQQ